MHEVNLDASLEAVYGRLAGRHKAGIAQAAEHAPRKREDGTSSVSACSTLTEDKQESE